MKNAFKNRISLKFTAILICFFFTIDASAQQKYFFWYFPSCGDTINGVAIGVFDWTHEDSCVTVVNGFRLEPIGISTFAIGFEKFESDYSHRLESLKDSLSSIPRDVINGINLSLLGTYDEISINGISISFLTQSVSNTNGILIASFANICRGRINGLQTSIFRNEAVITNGLQLSVFYNNSLELNGVQIGLFNKIKNGSGLQIGLWNKNQKRNLPFINF